MVFILAGENYLRPILSQAVGFWKGPHDEVGMFHCPPTRWSSVGPIISLDISFFICKIEIIAISFSRDINDIKCGEGWIGQEGSGKRRPRTGLRGREKIQAGQWQTLLSQLAFPSLMIRKEPTCSLGLREKTVGILLSSD